ncbi:hypothetical protein FACS189426_23690 [Bacteroidia bacterium]|nr:hypothetical protein FACS189426_23690 [Bacteroidia bacterium]
MKKKLNILLLSLIAPFFTYGQDTIPRVEQDTIPLTKTEPVLSDSIHRNLSMMNMPVSAIDTTQTINYWRITERTGEIFPVLPDTFLTDYFNRTNVEGQGISVAYLGNLGLPSESRLFFDRNDRSEFWLILENNLNNYGIK